MVPDIVPPDLLAPPDARSRSFRHDDAALVLDGYLRRLAAQEARSRVVLGRLSRAFLASDDASAITGAAIVVDAGLTIKTGADLFPPYPG